MNQPNNHDDDPTNQLPKIILIVNDGDWDCHYDAGMLVKRTNVLTDEMQSFYYGPPNPPIHMETPESNRVHDERSRVPTYDALGRLIDECNAMEQNDVVEHYAFQYPSGFSDFDNHSTLSQWTVYEPVVVAPAAFQRFSIAKGILIETRNHLCPTPNPN